MDFSTFGDEEGMLRQTEFERLEMEELEEEEEERAAVKRAILAPSYAGEEEGVGLDEDDVGLANGTLNLHPLLREQRQRALSLSLKSDLRRMQTRASLTLLQDARAFFAPIQEMKHSEAEAGREEVGQQGVGQQEDGEQEVGQQKVWQQDEEVEFLRPPSQMAAFLRGKVREVRRRGVAAMGPKELQHVLSSAKRSAPYVSGLLLSQLKSALFRQMQRALRKWPTPLSTKECSLPPNAPCLSIHAPLLVPPLLYMCLVAGRCMPWQRQSKKPAAATLTQWPACAAPLTTALARPV